MGFVSKRETSLKEITVGDNVKRLILSGQVPDGWLHCKLGFELEQLGKDCFQVIINFYSLADGSLVKKLRVKQSFSIGDEVRLGNVIGSYQLEITYSDEEGFS